MAQKVLAHVSSHSPERSGQLMAQDGVCNMSVWNSLRQGVEKDWVSLGKFFFTVLYSSPPSGIASSPDKELFSFPAFVSKKVFLFRKGILSYLTGNISCSPLTQLLLSFMRACCHLDVRNNQHADRMNQSLGRSTPAGRGRQSQSLRECTEFS